MEASVILRALAVPSLLGAVLLAQGGRGGDRAPAAGGADAASQDGLADLYFDTADWDGDGTIRFSEAAPSLEIDRQVFAAYDTDRDGLISRAEFKARYEAILARGGVFPAPRPKPQAAKPGWRTADELVREMDGDRDRGLSEAEVARALREADLQDPDAPTVMATLDKDRNAVLEGAEVEALVAVLRPPAAPAPAARKKTLAELFDHVEPRSERASATIAPPRIVGPVSLFRRLDFDADGGITLRDLVELQRPLTTAVRAPAVMATLDTNGDGRIDADELSNALR